MCDGETSVSAPDESRTADISKNTCKRRSIIFQRRSINHIKQDDVVNTCSDEPEIFNEQSNSHETCENEDDFDLRAYILSLKNEREEWKKILYERKLQRRRLTKQELNIENEYELDLSVLNDSERLFLASRPNYNKISKNIKDTIPLSVEIATLNRHINHLNESLIESMEEKIIESTKQIIELAKM